MPTSSILELLSGKVLLDDAFRSQLYNDPQAAAASLGVALTPELVQWLGVPENQAELDAIVASAQALTEAPFAIIWQEGPAIEVNPGLIPSRE